MNPCIFRNFGNGDTVRASSSQIIRGCEQSTSKDNPRIRATSFAEFPGHFLSSAAFQTCISCAHHRE